LVLQNILANDSNNSKSECIAESDALKTLMKEEGIFSVAYDADALTMNNWS
jgi:hypothetical protein